MRALLQRVSKARVVVDGEVVGFCGPGLVILLGVGVADDRAAAERLWRKVFGLRIFSDAAGKTNLSLRDVAGEVLIISQFTLYADCRRGMRPSFTDAARPPQAEELYEYFLSLASRDVDHVAHGVFGADMSLELTNDGPFTVWLDM